MLPFMYQDNTIMTQLTHSKLTLYWDANAKVIRIRLVSIHSYLNVIVLIGASSVIVKVQSSRMYV